MKKLINLTIINNWKMLNVEKDERMIREIKIKLLS